MLEAIEKKCRSHCGMIKAWEDGVCRADGLCPLYEWSPRREDGRSGVLDPKPTSTPAIGFEDL